MKKKLWSSFLPTKRGMFGHVWPTNDEREHILEGTGCWCNPTVTYNYPDGSVMPCPLVSHHAADCRELVEQVEVIKSRAANGR